MIQPRPRAPLSCLRFSCARARPRGRRFRSGGAGMELWGSFAARRSKPLAEGLSTACALSRFSGWIFRLARSPSLSLEAGGRRIRRRPGVVPAPMVWSIAGGAGGEVWGRLDEAAARELRRRDYSVCSLWIFRLEFLA